ncbi:Glycoside hydrolase family 5 protein [Mycena chlorophos]|uniref:Glycoside hydrolase family 5 protein n=1 Tax=Mycena chlorophos TaxID=658473 RepID=A0A8H6TDY9_MYCCL|nr:Glycoside hydrolase family 5 protein [Mycena chlorophos]
MAHVPYQSTPNFQAFVKTLKAAERPLDPELGASSTLRPPRHATFFGTVKLHGTNATVVFRNSDKRTAQIQSRSWIIQSTKKDNCGTYALLSKAPLHQLVDAILAKRGKGDAFDEVYICGEVAGKGVQKGVAITQIERFFAIFNIRVDGTWLDMRDFKDIALPEHRIFNVAQYKTYQVDIDFTASTAEVYALMQKYTMEVCEECPFGSAFVDAAGKKISGTGEGIVWTMVRSPYLDESEGRGFDDTLLCNFKTKGEAFATTAYAPKATAHLSPTQAAAAVEFATYALGERRLEQGIEYLESEQAREGLPMNGYDFKLTGAFLRWVMEDVLKEERHEMERLGVAEKDAKRELGALAKGWFLKKCGEVGRVTVLDSVIDRAMHLVYRALRRVSDWSCRYYFSEVYVDGAEFVPKDLPVILTPCHHNELIDVAMLSATLPYRRIVSFWAKSTTFKHPVLGPILESSGAIPVRRNPNKADAALSNAALFEASTATLRARGVMGIFPEGTSYTEPEIAQVLSGAGWAALEYMRSRGDGPPVLIIPVGIVYEDKSKYRSRVYVRYGPPIDVAQYMPPSLFDAADEEAERGAVKAVMREVENGLRGSTINARDWETVYAARMTRDILWTDSRNVQTKDCLVVGQSLVKTLSTSDDATLSTLKSALTKYYSLLHYTSITHAQLAALVPSISSVPSRLFVLRFIFTLLRTILNPAFIFFIPPFIAHLPAYLIASITNFMAPPGEEESQSQFKVFLGGFGTGIGTGVSGYWIAKLLTARFALEAAAQSKLAIWTLTTWLLIHWHLMLIDSNYRRIKRLGAAFKITLGALQPRSWALPETQLARYERPPTPAMNPFLRGNSSKEILGGKAWLKAQPPAVPSRRMIVHLLEARKAALDALGGFSENWKGAERQLVVELGGVLP